MIRRRLLQGVKAMGNIQIGSQTPENNILNMFYALENGTAKTGEFSFDTALPSGEHLIFESGLTDIKGLCIIDTGYDGYAKSEETTAFSLGFFEGGELVIATLLNSKNTATISFLARCNYRIDNGGLYVTPIFGGNKNYTPFRAGATYRWIAW